MAHLDDFIDPNAPYNEWIQWLSRRLRMSKNLSTDELAHYRTYYQKMKEKQTCENSKSQPVQNKAPGSPETCTHDDAVSTLAAKAIELERH
eukprot:13384658-Ditylum_brightwellii.AAC.1